MVLMRPWAQIAKHQMKMAAGWHFPVKVCMSAPLELQYVAYVCSKIELSGLNLLSVSQYRKPRQDSNIAIPSFHFISLQ